MSPESWRSILKRYPAFPHSHKSQSFLLPNRFQAMRCNEDESGLSLYLVELFWAYFERKFIAPISANNKWNQFKSKFCIWIIYDILIEQLSDHRIIFCEHSS